MWLIIEVKLWQVLDAPSLQDDFYLNLVDWSSQNVLAVGLGTCVYLWSASNSKVSLVLLCWEQIEVEFGMGCVIFYYAILFSGNKVV